MDLFTKCYEFTQVKEAVEAGIYPYFHALQSGQDTVVTMEGHRTIMIGSNNYLGLTSDPRVKEAAIKAVKVWFRLQRVQISKWHTGLAYRT